ARHAGSNVKTGVAMPIIPLPAQKIATVDRMAPIVTKIPDSRLGSGETRPIKGGVRQTEGPRRIGTLISGYGIEKSLHDGGACRNAANGDGAVGSRAGNVTDARSAEGVMLGEPHGIQAGFIRRAGGGIVRGGTHTAVAGDLGKNRGET